MISLARFNNSTIRRLWSSTNNATRLLSSSQTATDSAKGSEELKISDSCVERLKEITSDDGGHLRITVEGGGCSGFQYKFDIDNKINDDDRILEKGGIKVVVDITSLDYLKGSTVDYHKELIRSAFRIIDNPKAEQGCSCGASFAIKID
ncbi:iron-sulfur cluster assembly 2 homolog, mitochondrial [Neocloeon triangulifer]|uniref:iron-sulfur cluster assembly 2 homolog, mitochondrial n=1 Tax=Neocloeon triangulifer TaxID=2078957 RepID=UPI00286F7444|nr:iron-sulfur cluster assembly 2 homolog, mitochondrial [Neocloeon triangulifer]XP_059478374.1 iron-sulfur cluster assembly 2 homolog, mitochondrial [Neocloeon triangulifer]XP_059478381.1 iron-sulfur cluster assembly 2 homolog, mitochondrial [Neocloeon triangulifer]